MFLSILDWRVLGAATEFSSWVSLEIRPSLRGAKRRSNPFFLYAARWIASRSLSSGAHSRDPLARNDVKMRVRDPAARSVRVVQKSFAPIEGAGNAGCPLHPQPRVRSVESTRVFTTGPPGHPAFPHAMVLTVYV